MGSHLFRARVLAIAGQDCDLQLFIIHPDQKRIYASPFFALRLLWDPIHPVHQIDSPLGQAISIDQICDTEFVHAHADQFIEMVEFVSRKNYPAKINFDEMSREAFDSFWQDEERLQQAVLRITVTDPQWLAHLNPMMEWGTAAHNL